VQAASQVNAKKQRKIRILDGLRRKQTKIRSSRALMVTKLRAFMKSVIILDLVHGKRRWLVAM
jgi:hypothetical protein